MPKYMLNEDKEKVCHDCAEAQKQCCIEMLMEVETEESVTCTNCHKEI